MKQSDEFFAAVDAKYIAGVLYEKVEEWTRMFQQTAQYKRMRKSWGMYYGMTNNGGMNSSEIKEAGPRGEYSLIMMNHYRNFVQHLLVLTTSQRPALECQAANSDSASQEQTQLGDALLDWYMRDKKVERYLKNSCEYGLALSEGYLGMEWEATAGNIYTVSEDGSPVFEGDIGFTNYTPIDVVRDIWRNDTEMPWVITIKWKNRWNLSAKYKELADKILGVNPENLWRMREDFFNRTWWSENDLIPEFTFQHEKCEALPQGRLVKFLSNDVMLIDSPLPTEKVTVFRTSPSDQMDSIFGYTPAFDLLGPQEALNVCDSSMMTSIKTFGVGCVKLPEGHNVQYSQLADGLNALTINEKNGKAEAMSFLAIPPALPTFRTSVLTDMERLSGVNSILRGQPDTNITSGSYAALIASQAIQFNSGLQMSYTQLQEDVGNTAIEMLQKFAKTERVAKIVGKNSQYMLKSFSANDLEHIKGVLVQQANPLTKTNAGRMQMAEQLLANGLIKRPEQYQQVMETGKLEPIIENERTMLNNIKRENEMLRKGERPIALLTEDHRLHILEHASVIDDPEAKLNPQINQTTLNHIFEHISLWGQVPPELALALGRQPLAMPAPMNPGGAPAPAASSTKQNSKIDEGAQPGMPSAPVNPLTGESAPLEQSAEM